VAPPGYPVELERDALILDGTPVHLRPIRPDDASELAAFHARLAPRSVYLRFFTFHPTLSAREVEHFTHVDYHDRLALVAEMDRRLVAVGRYDRVAGTDDAEVAFVVEDGLHHQGLGTLLADELVRAARSRGVRAFVADTLPENREMLEMFRGLGLPLTWKFDGGVVRVRFPVEPVLVCAEALSRREAARRPDGPGAPAGGMGAPAVRARDATEDRGCARRP
jgi:GNAT superfamily N-acetyltransferase